MAAFVELSLHIRIVFLIFVCEIVFRFLIDFLVINNSKNIKSYEENFYFDCCCALRNEC